MSCGSYIFILFIIHKWISPFFNITYLNDTIRIITRIAQKYIFEHNVTNHINTIGANI